MEGMIGVESISVLCTVIIALQHWIWVPAFSVKVGMIGCEPTTLGYAFLSLAPLVGFAIGGVEKRIGRLEGIMSG